MAMIRKAAYLPLATFFVLASANAFRAPPRTSILLVRGCPFGSTRRLAYIFGAGEEESGCDYFSVGGSSAIAWHQHQQHHGSLLSRLNEATASLARVAAAFPPTGHSLQITSIEDIQVLGVEATSMELQAVVCEEDHCLTVAVPVKFPEPCTSSATISNDGINDSANDSSSDMEECVLENLEQLDKEAQLVLLQDEENTHSDAGSMDILQQLDLDDAALPPWWVSLPTMDMALNQECSSLKSLLNEDDFRDEIKGLAQHGIGTFNEPAMYVLHVELAAVARICSAGLILRALVQDSTQGNKRTVTVPIAFHTRAMDATQLRESVIQTIEQYAS